MIGILGVRGGFQNRTQSLPNILRDKLLPFDIWVNPVRLIQARHSAHPFEKERNQRGIAGLGDFRKECAISRHEIGAHVRRHFHSSDDDLNAGKLRPGSLDNAGEVFLGLLRRNSAQSIVAAESYDNDGGATLQRPVEPPQTACRCIAADSRIHHGERQASRRDFLLKQGGISLIAIEAVARGDAITEDDDPAGWIPRAI